VQFPAGNQLVFPSIGTTVTNPVQNSLESGRSSKVHEVMDNATWVRSNHIFQFGGNFRRTEVEPFSFAGILPQYTIGFGAGNINPLSSTNTLPTVHQVMSKEQNNAATLASML
jgi:hypothetical protein